MPGRRLTLCFMLLLSDPTTTQQSPWCPPTQRYDVHQFPPRCLDCPKTTLNPMRLSSIGTRVRPGRQHVAKFSPGLPHNQTCGCWRAGNQSVIDVSLNASWIVSGLTFHVDRNRWLRRFSVAASGDNTTFLDWGTYTQDNFSASAAVFFRYPIRATYFKISVFEYINHMINASDGFPVRINALVSDSEPFGCACAALDSGECCPLANMEVKNNTCMMCMDPADIHTVMVDGCGRCKPGTRQVGLTLRCAPVVPVGKNNTSSGNALDVLNANSTDDEWRLYVDVGSADGNNSTLHVLFLSGGDELLPCTPIALTGECFSSYFTSGKFIPLLWNLLLDPYGNISAPPVAQTERQINQQYLQFDRGRQLLLILNESTVSSWAQCNNRVCAGRLGMLFISPIKDTSHFLVDVVRQPLVLELSKPPPQTLVCSFSRRLIPTAVEIHHLLDTDQYRIVLSSSANASSVQWDDGLVIAVGEEDGIMEHPPPTEWFSMRVFAGDQQYSVLPPVPVVKKKRSRLSLQFAKESIRVKVSYGFGLKPAPVPGDSEQLVTISAISKQPMRLTRMASVTGLSTTLYTTSRGFISDSRRALDLVVACNGMMSIDAMVTWLESALGLMGAVDMMQSFSEQACGRVIKGEISKLYWLVPTRPIGTGRREEVNLRVEVDFV